MSKAYERLEQQVGEEKAELMIHYMDEILRMNEHINLTAVWDPEEFIVKHLLDSLGCVGSPEWEKADTIADVGTGAGFPGRFFHRKLLGPSCTFRRYPTPCPVP